MQLYFIRHGQSENNAAYARGETRAHSDPELTELGHQQASHLADFLSQNHTSISQDHSDPQNLRGFHFTNLYCSLMVRAVATGAHLAKALNLPLTAWPEIHEEGGIFWQEVPDGPKTGLPGKTRSYFQAHYPELLLPDDLDEHGWWNRPFEKLEECPLRARRVLEALLARHGDQQDQPEHKVALVSHGGFFMHLMTRILNLSWREAALDYQFWFLMNNCAITRLDFVDGEVGILYSNRVGFLPAKLVT